MLNVNKGGGRELSFTMHSARESHRTAYQDTQHCCPETVVLHRFNWCVKNIHISALTLHDPYPLEKILQ